MSVRVRCWGSMATKHWAVEILLFKASRTRSPKTRTWRKNKASGQLSKGRSIWNGIALISPSHTSTEANRAILAKRCISGFWAERSGLACYVTPWAREMQTPDIPAAVLFSKAAKTVNCAPLYNSMWSVCAFMLYSQSCKLEREGRRFEILSALLQSEPGVV